MSFRLFSVRLSALVRCRRNLHLGHSENRPWLVKDDAGPAMGGLVLECSRCAGAITQRVDSPRETAAMEPLRTDMPPLYFGGLEDTP